MVALITSVDTKRFDASLARVKRQIPFVTAATLTALAKDGKIAAEAQIERAFDRPTPFTKRAVAIIPARKNRPVATVLIKDIQATYLGLQERGGTRVPKPGSPIQPPFSIKLNRYGNVPRGAIRRAVNRPDVFVATPDNPRTAHLPPGIYKRARRGTRRRGGRGTIGRVNKGIGGLQLLVAFEPSARYRPRFGFVPTVRKTVSRMLIPRFRQNLARALLTARR